MITTTGSSIQNYLDWVRDELQKKSYGEVGIVFTIVRGQVTAVKKSSVDTDSIPLKSKYDVPEFNEKLLRK